MAARGWATLVMVIALSAGLGACHSSPSTPKSDAGAMDKTPTEGGPTDMSVTCTDDGTHNKDIGLSCSCDTQCKSGFCVDGVCCNTACTGTCVSCAVSPSPGTCLMIPASVRPRNTTDCVAGVRSSCGLDGMCDGMGKCEMYPTGTPCRPGSCDGDAVIGQFQCDGVGGCKLGASTVCAPFSCNPATNACFGSCSIDGDCVAGQKCDQGSCGKKMIGAACTVATECASGNCADGVCCNSKCDGVCRTCSLVNHVGTCSATPVGQGHPNCGKTDQSTCGTTGVCDGFGGCSKFSANTVCGAATCSGNTLEMARTCDGDGACGAPEAQGCDPYRCTDGACTSNCMTAADCADGIACENESCGPKQDGQSCKINGECLNGHCVDGVCCENACDGSCRSCSLPNLAGKCTLVANNAADPRGMCKDLTAAMCSTDGKCDGGGGCQKYPVGSQCADEDCTTDVYTGPSTCNGSSQCIKPTALPCNPYHCNANKCFGACTTNDQCVAPNICGQDGNISSCGKKAQGLDCSTDAECGTGHCAQGKCCDTACTGACKACNLNASPGVCSDVQSGTDPQGLCAATAATTCGTTGMCAAGQCAKFSTSTVCKPASCVAGGPPSSAAVPQSKCDGNGACVTPSTVGCAPGRCDTTALMCVNTCTTTADCTNPNTCVNGSCGLIAKGGTCANTNQCSSGLTCNHDKVCCDQACDGVCETCKPPSGTAGTCTPVGGGQADPSMMCVAMASSTCGTNGNCSGNNTVAGTARCQAYPGSTACGTQSCTDGATSGAASTLKLVSNCSGGGVCNAAPTQSCGAYKCLNATQCGTTCNADTDCVGTTCNTVTKKCGTKQAPGAMCNITSDCDSTAPNCADGVCCNTACTGACMACNLTGSAGTCTGVAVGTSDTLCPAAAAMTCGNTGSCAAGGVCAKRGSETVCRAASCATSASSVAVTTCNGTDTCPTAPAAVSCAAPSCTGTAPTFMMTTAGTCSGAGVCAAGTTSPCGTFTCNGTACRTMCTVDTDCANGLGCNTSTHACTGWVAGHACPATGGACGSTLTCVDGVCCNTACTGACQACNLTSTVGTCSPVTSGSDAACAPTSNACGNTGMCAATGMCQMAAAGTVAAACGAPSCASDMFVPGGTCNGSGACGTQPAAAPCPMNLGCADTSSCFPFCTSLAQCAASATMCNVDGSCT
ncbi:MAG TPA: hypothetical protein VGP07_26220 [Polyangia bacterium]